MPLGFGVKQGSFQGFSGRLLLIVALKIWMN